MEGDVLKGYYDKRIVYERSYDTCKINVHARTYSYELFVLV